jgi:urease accessory protein
MTGLDFCKQYIDIHQVDFSTARELKDYLSEPLAMYVGAPGKHGYLNMRFELDENGKSVLRNLDRRVPIVVQQELYFDEQMPEMPCVYVLSSGGQYVDGDRYRQDISVGKCAMAWISTGAATKIAEMKYNYSGVQQTIVLDDNAYLEYMPEQVIPCRHARYISDTQLIVAQSATIFYSEIFTCGRKYYGNGEKFEFDILSVSTRAERPDSTKLFKEKFIIEPTKQNIYGIGCMSNYDVYANVIVITPTENVSTIYNRIAPCMNNEIAIGISTLPNKTGLIYKVLGTDVTLVKKLIRNFCSDVRQVVKYKPLPKEFPWR